MKRGIVSKVYKSLRNGLKIGYDKILYYRTYDEYERANKGINDADYIIDMNGLRFFIFNI